MEPTVLFRAFTTVVRPDIVVMSFSPVWVPVYKWDMNQIEPVLRRFTKKLHSFKRVIYSHEQKY